MDLNFKVLGSGKPVVIFHGLLGSLDNWITISRTLSNKYKVILVDLPNHGKSYHTDEFSYQKMSEKIHELFLSLNLSSVSVIGHSMGGKLAIKYIDNYSSFVDKVVIVDIANKNYSSNRFNYIFNGINEINLSSFRSRSQINEAISNFISDIGERNFILKNLKRIESGFEWSPNIILLQKSLNEISSKIKLRSKIFNETLFLFGENSQYYNRDDIKNLSTDFENFNIKIISNSGHWIHAENPSDFLSSVDNFLSSRV